MGVDPVEFASLEEGGDYGPVLGSGVMTREECVLAVQRNRADRSLHGVGIQLDAAILEEQDQPVPVFGDVFQGLADWGFGRHAGTVRR